MDVCEEKAEESITVVSPNGGEQWVVGETKRVSWQSSDVKYVRIYIYDDSLSGSGSTNYIYDGALSANAGYYDWTIKQNQLPGSTSIPRQYKIRIDGLNEATVGATVLVKDHSDSYFTITEKTVALWNWDYCTANSPCDAGQGDCDVDTDCNTGYCALNVGTKYGQVSSMDVCEEKEEVAPSITITSPNGGERWKVNENYKISWTNSETGISLKVNILLLGYDQYGNSISDSKYIASGIDNRGYYYWTPTNEILSSFPITAAKYKIKITQAGGTLQGNEAEGISDGYFSIVEKTVALWSWDYCTANSPCDAGEGDCDTDADCTTGYCALNVGTKYGQVSSMDVCEEKAEESITITSPNGGEQLEIGQTYNITWESTGVDKVMIELEKESQGWHLIYSVLASQGYYSWTIGDLTPASNYKINIWDTENTSINDKSDNYFSIVEEEKSITVVSPNGGEQWETGEIHTIKWISTGYGSNTSIQIGLRDTRYDSTLAAGEATIANTTNSGSYAWTIPSDPSDLGFEIFGAGNVYKIVIHIAGGGPGKFDLSDNYFSIVEEEKSITVISPNGGEQWELTGTYNIVWDSIGLTNEHDLNIVILDGRAGWSYYAIVTDLPGNQGVYSWTIPTEGILPGTTNTFKIWIGEYMPPAQSGDWESLKTTANSQTYGESGMFDIIEPALGLQNIEEQLASISEAISNLLENVEELLK